MDVAIRTIDQAQDQEAVARLRYQVFVRDMDRRPTGTDDELEQVRDPDDARLVLYSVDIGSIDSPDASAREGVPGTIR